MKTPDDHRLPYLQIVDDLRRSIAFGEIAPGSKLPSNADLKRRYGVASQTAQNAVNVLKSEGLVYGVAGRGVFVKSDVEISSLRKEIASAAGAPHPEVLGRLASLEARLAKIEEMLDTSEKD